MCAQNQAWRTANMHVRDSDTYVNLNQILTATTSPALCHKSFTEVLDAMGQQVLQSAPTCFDNLGAPRHDPC